MKCVMCTQEIPGGGNGYDAEPVVFGGRCCGDCHDNVVAPIRIAAADLELKAGQISEFATRAWKECNTQEQLDALVEEYRGKG